MPTLNQAEEKFLMAIRHYVDFRMMNGVDEAAGTAGELLVSSFREFVASRPLKAKSKPDTIPFLIEKMVKLQESRGTGQPPPNDPPTPS